MLDSKRALSPPSPSQPMPSHSLVCLRENDAFQEAWILILADLVLGSRVICQ